MAGRMAGKTAFCTAAAAGIGRATALRLRCARAPKVIATDIGSRRARLASSRAERLALDVLLDAGGSTPLARQVGAVDVLFNCAGFVHHGTVLDCSEQDWDFSFDLNVKSMHRTITAFLPGMLEQGRRLDRQHRLGRLSA